MIDIDSALYRMKAYSGLLLASTTHEQKDIGQDITILVKWIEYARPLVGCVSAAVDNPFNQVMQRHGMNANQHQYLSDPKPKNPDDDPAMPPEPQPVEPPPPPPAEAPVEDKPVA